MSSLKRRIEAAVDSRIAALTEVRIAAVAATAADLRTQLNELHQLRDQIKRVYAGIAGDDYWRTRQRSEPLGLR
ncbi:putative membrane protein [Bradyrhizobium sp. GM7.3]